MDSCKQLHRTEPDAAMVLNDYQRELERFCAVQTEVRCEINFQWRRAYEPAS
jgi:hypothetical protein